MEKVQIKPNLNLDNPVHISLIIPGWADNRRVLIGKYSLQRLANPNITISIRGVMKNDIEPMFSYYCRYMFSESTSVVDVDMSSINTEYIRYLGYAFEQSGVKEITFNNLKRLTGLYGCFYECRNLERVQFRSRKGGIPKVSEIDHMFCDCPNLLSVDLRGLNLENVIYANFMFYGCEKLRCVKFEKFPKLGVFYRYGIVSGCKSLHEGIARIIFNGGELDKHFLKIREAVKSRH